MRDLLKDGEVKQRRHPKNDVENDRAEKLREDDLPVAHRCGHERFDRAELKLFRKKPHGNERKNQNEGEPEENRIKKCFLHRVLHWALVHVADLEIEIDAAHEQEKNEHDVSDRRVEVTAHFAHQKREKLSHSPDMRVIPNEVRDLSFGSWLHQFLAVTFASFGRSFAPLMMTISTSAYC